MHVLLQDFFLVKSIVMELIEISYMVNAAKFQTFFSFSSQIKCLLSGLKLTKCLSEKQTRKTEIRLLLQKQSDLGLLCLSRLLWLAN